MLFAVTPVVTVFCLLPSPPTPPEKRTEGSGDLTRGRGALSSRIRCLSQSSHSKTGDLYMSDFLSERLMNKNLPVWGSAELNTRVRSCRGDLEKHSSVPQSLLEPLVRLLGSWSFSEPWSEGVAAWPGLWLPSERVVSCKAHMGWHVLVGFLLLLLFFLHTNLVKTILQSNSVS